MRQRLVWVEFDTTLGPQGRHRPIKVARSPTRVWSLYQHDRHRKPAFPFQPAHHVNAFLEDTVHDYNWRGGVLHYHPHSNNHSLWVLLEYV